MNEDRDDMHSFPTEKLELFVAHYLQTQKYSNTLRYFGREAKHISSDLKRTIEFNSPIFVDGHSLQATLNSFQVLKEKASNESHTVSRGYLSRILDRFESLLVELRCATRQKETAVTQNQLYKRKSSRSSIVLPPVNQKSGDFLVPLPPASPSSSFFVEQNDQNEVEATQDPPAPMDPPAPNDHLAPNDLPLSTVDEAPHRSRRKPQQTSPRKVRRRSGHHNLVLNELIDEDTFYEVFTANALQIASAATHVLQAKESVSNGLPSGNNESRACDVPSSAASPFNCYSNAASFLDFDNILNQFGFEMPGSPNGSDMQLNADDSALISNSSANVNGDTLETPFKNGDFPSAAFNSIQENINRVEGIKRKLIDEGEQFAMHTAAKLPRFNETDANVNGFCEIPSTVTDAPAVECSSSSAPRHEPQNLINDEENAILVENHSERSSEINQIDSLILMHDEPNDTAINTGCQIAKSKSTPTLIVPPKFVETSQRSRTKFNVEIELNPIDATEEDEGEEMQEAAIDLSSQFENRKTIRADSDDDEAQESAAFEAWMEKENIDQSDESDNHQAGPSNGGAMNDLLHSGSASNGCEKLSKTPRKDPKTSIDKNAEILKALSPVQIEKALRKLYPNR